MNHNVELRSDDTPGAICAAGNGAVGVWHLALSEIVEIVEEIEETRTYQLRMLDERSASQYRFLPGQFNMLYVPGCGEIAISLSGHAENDGRALVHTIRRVGRVTEPFFELKIGDRVGIRGPYGSAWPHAELTGRDVVIVAGGLGMAPLRPLLYQLIDRRKHVGRITLLSGARTPELFLYQQEFDDWRRHGIDVRQIVDRPAATWSGAVGFVPLLLENMEAFIPDQTSVITCGPEAMMHSVAKVALLRGVTADSIWLSLERHMQCAVGFCGHCQLGQMFVCREGPVFRFDQVNHLLAHKDL